MHYLKPSKTEARLGSLVVRSAFIVSLALAILAAPFPVAAQPPSKEFRVGHLFGAAGRPMVCRPAHSGRAYASSVMSRAGTSRTSHALQRARWTGSLAWRRSSCGSRWTLS